MVNGLPPHSSNGISNIADIENIIQRNVLSKSEKSEGVYSEIYLNHAVWLQTANWLKHFEAQTSHFLLFLPQGCKSHDRCLKFSGRKLQILQLRPQPCDLFLLHLTVFNAMLLFELCMHFWPLLALAIVIDLHFAFLSRSAVCLAVFTMSNLLQPIFPSLLKFEGPFSGKSFDQSLTHAHTRQEWIII